MRRIPGLLIWTDRHAVAVAALAALGLILLTAVTFGGRVRFPDEGEYLSLAHTLLHDGVFGHDAATPTAFRPPGYVFFLTAVVAVRETVLFVQGVQVALWALAAVLAARIARETGGPAAAGATLLLALGYPVFAFGATTVFPQTLMAALLLGTVLVLVRTAARPGVAELAAVALAMAALVLVNPLTLPYAVVAPVALVWLRRAGWGQAALLWAVPALAVAAWMLRNAAVMDAPGVIATNQGINLLLGNSELARPELGTNTDISAYTAAAEGMGEVARDRFYHDAAMAWIRDNPGAALRLYLRKLANFFAVSNELKTAGEGSVLRDAVLFVSFWGLMALAALRLAVSARPRERRIELLLVLLYLASALAYSVFFNRVRFRIPSDYLLVVLAGGGAAWVASWLAAPRSAGSGAVREPGAERPRPAR